ncbi:hypothetical protein RDI58_026506 [Solanum bulbocastanum]|uniref:DUF4283 domain-containing protein n=1 Tax=Solanum bulbocastanum TaxID=147425 RepID=A0AAN8STV6_SOLBU
MPLAWGNPVGLLIKDVGWNLFQFIFRDKKILNKVQLGTPWMYDKHLLNVHPWEPGLKHVSLLFDICNMWVQVWNIPLHWISKDVGCKIENALGGICDVVIPENGSKEGRYMRLKVMMNIIKPLPRENHAISLGHHRREEGHNTNERDIMVRKHNLNLIKGRIWDETIRNLQHLKKKVDSTNVQLRWKEEDYHGLDQNKSKEKGQEKEPLLVLQCNVWILARERKIYAQLDKNRNDNTPKGMEGAIQINTKELQAKINQTTKIMDQIIGKDICEAVRSFFSSEILIPEWSQTLITLIPKVKIPTVVAQFRPISLCSTAYKIIGKVSG